MRAMVKHSTQTTDCDSGHPFARKLDSQENRCRERLLN